MKKLLALAMALSLALTLAACGSKAPASSAPAASEAPSQGGSSEAAGDDMSLENIKKAGKIVMLTNATFPPFEYLGSDGSVAGVDADVAAEIAKDLGVKLEIVDMNFDLLIEAVKAGKGDFAAAGMTINPERQAQVDFSVEYVKSAQYAVVKKDSTLKTDNLKGLTVAVQESTTGDFYATDNLEAKEVLRFKNATDTGSALSTGKCDVVIIDKLPAEAIAANSNSELIVLPESLTEESYAFAVKKGNQALLDAINATMKRLMDAGEIDGYVTKHMSAA